MVLSFEFEVLPRTEEVQNYDTVIFIHERTVHRDWYQVEN